MATLLYESYYAVENPYESYLMHHGIKGQKWGVRRFQNSDGSLTAAGRARYLTGEAGKKIGEAARRTYDSAKKKYESIQESRAKKQEELSAKRAEDEKEDIARAVAEGNAAKIAKYSSKMTTQQLQDAVQRVRLKTELSKLTPGRKTALDRLKKVTDVNNTVTNLIKSYKDLNKTIFGKGEKDGDGKKKGKGKNDEKKDPFDNEAGYESTMADARKNVAADARKKAAKEGKSILEQERAARDAIEKFNSAAKKSGSSEFKSGIMHREATLNQRVKDLSNKTFPPAVSSQTPFISSYWKKERRNRSPLTTRVSDLNRRMSNLG